MDNLPQEVVDLIAEFVEGRKEGERVAAYEPDADEVAQPAVEGEEDLLQYYSDNGERDDDDDGSDEESDYEGSDYGADYGIDKSHAMGQGMVLTRQEDGSWVISNPAMDPETAHENPPAMSRSPLSSLSRAWKSAIERIGFRTLRITSDELEDFSNIVRGTRRIALEKLVLVVMLSPTWKVKGRCHSQRFSKALHYLFSILSSWEAEGLSEGELTLEIRFAYSKKHRKWDLSSELDSAHEAQVLKDLLQYRSGKFHIHLLRPDDLFAVTRITGIWYEEEHLKHYDLRLAPSSLGQIMGKLPSLSSTNLDLLELDHMMMCHDDTKEHKRNNSENLDGNEEDKNKEASNGDSENSAENETDPYSFAAFCPMLDARRREERLAFAQSLASVPPPSRGKLNIFMYKDEHYDRGDDPEPIYDFSKHSFDPLSDALRKHSVDLAGFSFGGLVDSTLFWPKDEGKDQEVEMPSWPHMENIHIMFDPQTPCGDWYFASTRVPRPRLNSHEGSYVCEPVDKFIDPLLKAFAKAVGKMPLLQAATLCSDSIYGLTSMRVEFQIEYWAPGYRDSKIGVESEKYNDDVNVRRFYFKFGSWVPSTEMLAVLRNMGAEFHGTEFIERFEAPRSEADEGQFMVINLTQDADDGGVQNAGAGGMQDAEVGEDQDV